MFEDYIAQDRSMKIHLKNIVHRLRRHTLDPKVIARDIHWGRGCQCKCSFSFFCETYYIMALKYP